MDPSGPCRRKREPDGTSRFAVPSNRQGTLLNLNALGQLAKRAVLASIRTEVAASKRHSTDSNSASAVAGEVANHFLGADRIVCRWCRDRASSHPRTWPTGAVEVSWFLSSVSSLLIFVLSTPGFAGGNELCLDFGDDVDALLSPYRPCRSWQRRGRGRPDGRQALLSERMVVAIDQ